MVRRPIQKRQVMRKAKPQKRGRVKLTPNEAKIIVTEATKRSNAVSFLKKRGLDFNKLSEQGIGVKFLRRKGLEIDEIVKLGAKPKDLVGKGIPLKRVIHEVPTNELKKLGVPAKSLLKAGMPVGRMYLSGYTQKELLEAGVNPSTMKLITEYFREKGIKPKRN